MVLHSVSRLGLCAVIAGLFVIPDLSLAQEPIPLPGITVEANTPPPINEPSASDPGPAAQARKPSPKFETAGSPKPSQAAASQTQSANVPEPTTPVVETPNRVPQELATVATATTVIGSTEIERARSAGASVGALLKGTPGLDVRNSGGVGGTTEIQMRGADSDQTLVMIDGVRLNDPTSTGSEFDFSVLSLANVERIEVLRGPQSGLYGGDAIGGVINIISRRGDGPATGFAEIEGGAYSTLSERAGVSGSKDRFSYAVGLSNFRTSGFSRRVGGEEKDGSDKQAITGTFGYQASDTIDLSARLGYYRVRADLDIVNAESLDEVTRDLWDSAVSARINSFSGLLTTRVTAFANVTGREFRECTSSACGDTKISNFDGSRRGLEFQSDLRPNDAHLLTAGARFEVIRGASEDSFTDGSATLARYDIREHHRGAFLSYLFQPSDAFLFTAAGRIDDFDSGIIEPTYRFTSAYRVEATDTKFRASYGTGAKAPTIQQRFDTNHIFGITVSGNPDLKTERSRGFDVGVDQLLLDGRLELSATYFRNEISNLIDFTTDGSTATFENISSARLSGVELAGAWRALEWLRVRAAYTYLDAQNLDLNEPLERRPKHTAKATLEIEPRRGVYVAFTVLHKSDHFDRSGQSSSGSPRDRRLVDGYTRFDAAGEWQLSDHATVFVRAENLTDTDYQEVRNFATPGRSAYAGLRLRF